MLFRDHCQLAVCFLLIGGASACVQSDRTPCSDDTDCAGEPQPSVCFQSFCRVDPSNGDGGETRAPDSGLDAGDDRDAGTPAPDGGADAGTDAGEGGPNDAGLTDAGPGDGGLIDGGLLDAGSVDAGSVDAGLLDGGAPDGGLAHGEVLLPEVFEGSGTFEVVGVNGTLGQTMGDASIVVEQGTSVDLDHSLGGISSTSTVELNPNAALQLTGDRWRFGTFDLGIGSEINWSGVGGEVDTLECLLSGVNLDVTGELGVVVAAAENACTVNVLAGRLSVPNEIPAAISINTSGGAELVVAGRIDLSYVENVDWVGGDTELIISGAYQGSRGHLVVRAAQNNGFADTPDPVHTLENGGLLEVVPVPGNFDALHINDNDTLRVRGDGNELDGELAVFGRLEMLGDSELRMFPAGDMRTLQVQQEGVVRMSVTDEISDIGDLRILSPSTLEVVDGPDGPPSPGNYVLMRAQSAPFPFSNFNVLNLTTNGDLDFGVSNDNNNLVLTVTDD